jgi:hypothetical protein
MPLHLHFADPPKLELKQTPQSGGVAFAVATISSCLVVLAATYWFLTR